MSTGLLEHQLVMHPLIYARLEYVDVFMYVDGIRRTDYVDELNRAC